MAPQGTRAAAAVPKWVATGDTGEIGDRTLVGAYCVAVKPGPIPPELGQLDSLEQLNLSHNAKLAGALPNAMTAPKMLRSLVAGEGDRYPGEGHGHPHRG